MILAAGLGSRFGSFPKTLLPYRGQTLLEHLLDQVQAAGLSSCLVVASSTAASVASILERRRQPGERMLINPKASLGLMSSVQAALLALPAECEAAMFCLGDMPLLDVSSLRQLLAAYTPHALLRMRSPEGPGHPVLIPRGFWPEVLAEPLRDQGCGFLFQRYPQRVQEILYGSAQEALDIDTYEDWLSCQKYQEERGEESP